MNKIVVKNKKKIERFRERIFKSKEEYRKEFAKEPFARKLKTAFKLYKRLQYLKEFKPVKIQNDKTSEP